MVKDECFYTNDNYISFHLFEWKYARDFEETKIPRRRRPQIHLLTSQIRMSAARAARTRCNAISLLMNASDIFQIGRMSIRLDVTIISFSLIDDLSA